MKKTEIRNKPHILNVAHGRKKVAHEAPISILEDVQKYTDYDYCLVHLLEESEEYRKFFYNIRGNKAWYIRNRRIILDNSIFELGKAFDGEKYLHYIEELNPTIYIMPDVLGDASATIESCKIWEEIHTKSYTMAVVQGQSMDELAECYKVFKDRVDAIAIGFNHEFFANSLETKDWDQANGRLRFVRYLKEKGIWDTNIYHHLLGCTLPFEFGSSIYNDINSLDTSSPVVHGLLGVEFNELGITKKAKIKADTLMYTKADEEQLHLIVENIKKFKKLFNENLYS